MSSAERIAERDEERFHAALKDAGWTLRESTTEGKVWYFPIGGENEFEPMSFWKVYEDSTGYQMLRALWEQESGS